MSYVGFEEFVVDAVRVAAGERVDLGTIDLTPTVQALEDVEVTAERQAVEFRVDRTVYNTADDPLAAGASATDILETLPSVDVDLDGNVSLRGSGEVTVLINGRPAPVGAELVADYLAQLPADAVERVEIIPNPSARYEPDGTAGILNIVLREDTDPGLGGSLSASVDTRGSFNTTNLLSYGAGPWSLSANYSFRRGMRERERTSFRINRFADPITSLDQTSLDDRLRTTNLLGLAADYQAGSRTTLTGQFQLRTWQHDEDRFVSTLTLGDERVTQAASERMVRDDENRISGDLRFGLRHDFGDDHRLTAETRLNAQFRDRYEFIEERPIQGDLDDYLDRNTYLDRTDRRVALDVDYVRPIAGFRTEAGYNFFVRLQERDFTSESRPTPSDPFLNDAGLTNASEYGLWIHALYGQVAREMGPLGVQVGVRLETALTDFTVLDTGENYVNQYFSAFPSAFAVYELSDSRSVRAAYSRRVQRPRTDHQNPFPRFDDPLNIYVGNPDIRPSYIDAVELSFIQHVPFGSLTLSPYARRATDVIRSIVQVRPDGVTERTVTNLATNESYGIEGVFSFEAMQRALRGFVSVEGFRVMTDGVAGDMALQADGFGWGGRANVNLGLDRLGVSGMVLQSSVRYRAPMRTEQGRSGARLFIDIALRQRFMDERLALNLRVRDPLGMARFNSILDQPALYQETSADWGAQRMQVSLSYRFNQPEQRRDRDTPPPDDGDFDEEF